MRTCSHAVEYCSEKGSSIVPFVELLAENDYQPLVEIADLCHVNEDGYEKRFFIARRGHAIDGLPDGIPCL